MRWLVIACFFIPAMVVTGVARATPACDRVLGGERLHWVAHDTSKVVRLSPKDLPINGVAHLKIPLALMSPFLTTVERGADRDQAAKNDAYEKISKRIKKSLLEAYPGATVERVGYGSEPFERKRRKPKPAPFGLTSVWHVDIEDKDLAPNISRFLKGTLKKFTVRTTLLAPMNIFPTTLVKPAGGSLAGQVVQASPGHATMMVLEVTEHSGDFRYVNDGRGLISWDFDVKTESK